MKKIFALLVLVCILLVGCGNKEPERTPITSADAVQVVVNDLDMDIAALQPHVHQGEYQGTACYYVYVTVDGENIAYAIDLYLGEILNISESEHSH